MRRTEIVQSSFQRFREDLISAAKQTGNLFNTHQVCYLHVAIPFRVDYLQILFPFSRLLQQQLYPENQISKKAFHSMSAGCI